MGMFGNLFGQQQVAQPYAPILDVDGIPGASGVAIPQPGPGFNDDGGLGGKLGQLGGLILAAGGNPAGSAVLQQFAQRDQRKQQLQDYATQQRDRLATWTAQQEYERAHPKPANPTALQQNYEYLKAMDPNLATNYLQNQANPVQGIEVTDPSTGVRSIRFVPRGGPAGVTPSAPSGPPAEAVAYLRSNPTLATQFDAKYGAGASQQILQGGAPSQGSATFR